MLVDILEGTRNNTYNIVLQKGYSKKIKTDNKYDNKDYIY